MNDPTRTYVDKDNRKICGADYFVISTQYVNIDKAALTDILNIVKKMNKKLIVVTEQPFFKMYGRFSILEYFIIKNKRLPNKNELELLEKKYYKSKENNLIQSKLNKMLKLFANENKISRNFTSKIARKV